jgi:hypothetical protein
VLECPFPPELIRSRKGTFGKQLDYVEVAYYIKRLNEAFAGAWSFDVLEHRVLDAEVVVLGRLSVGGISKTAFGSSALTTSRETGDKVSVGDDLKAAASDALKKCSSLLGLGLHLYGLADEPMPGGQETNTVPFPARNDGGDAEKGGRVLTSRQYSAILTLAEKAGYSQAEVKTRVLDIYGIPLEKLGRRTASELITELNAKVNGRAAGGAA